MKSRITEPTLDWDEKGNPLSQLHSDPYFSRENGIEESKQVFLQGNRLQERFAALQPGNEFVVAETGFGTGLNFMLTCQLFRQQAPPGARLFYISLEGYPMDSRQLQRAHNHWPQLQEESAALLEHWPARVPGFHPLQPFDNVCLLLIFDQAQAGLAELMPHPDKRNQRLLPRPVDAWYLDGFAPSRNPDMWSDAVFRSIALLSHEQTSLATYSVAGSVRRGLAAAGFHCTRQKGYGSKRQMLVATLEDGTAAVPATSHSKTGKYHQVWHRCETNQAIDTGRVGIVGGGIAGVTPTIQLNRLGVPVDLYEREPHLAALTSGNPQAAVFARLSTDRGELEDFALASLSYACRFYLPWWNAGLGQQCGILQLPRDDVEASRLQQLHSKLPPGNGLLDWVSRENASRLAGIQLDSPALHMPSAGWIEATALSDSLGNNDKIRIHTGHTPTIRAAENGWILGQHGQERSYRNLVFCSGFYDSPEGFPSLRYIDSCIRPVGGQISLLGETAESAQLKSILCQRHYLTPAHGGAHSLGATYRLGDSQLDSRPGDNSENLGFVENMAAFAGSQVVGARTGVRATTPDYLPLCGPVPNPESLGRSHGYLAQDARQLKDIPIESVAGLYCLRGLGSRGFTYAPLCALHLARQICGLHSPLPDHLQRAMHPARFAIRGIIRSNKQRN